MDNAVEPLIDSIEYNERYRNAHVVYSLTMGDETVRFELIIDSSYFLPKNAPQGAVPDQDTILSVVERMVLEQATHHFEAVKNIEQGDDS